MGENKGDVSHKTAKWLVVWAGDKVEGLLQEGRVGGKEAVEDGGVVDGGEERLGSATLGGCITSNALLTPGN